MRHYCQICGQDKVHTRLYGYQCTNPEHQPMEWELERNDYMSSAPDAAIYHNCRHCKAQVSKQSNYCKFCGWDLKLTEDAR
jgi:hypothetical protein